MAGAADNDAFLDASDTVESKLCYKNCTVDSQTNMIACDAPTCDIEWFHWECVGLNKETVPAKKKKWLCPSCALDLEMTLAPKSGVSEEEEEDKDVRPKKPVVKKKDMLRDLRHEQRRIEIELTQARINQSRAELSSLHSRGERRDGRREQPSHSRVSPGGHASGSMEGPGQIIQQDGKVETDMKAMLDKLYIEDDSSSDDENGKTSSGKKKKISKSGHYSKASDDVVISQPWPHLALCLEYSSRDICFNDLTLPQFVAGETEIISDCIDPHEKQARINFLKALMYDAVSCQFCSILNWYAAWVREIELGKKCWGNDFYKVGDINLKRAALVPDAAGVRGKSKKTSVNQKKLVWYCSLYNRSKCNKDSPHKHMINNKMREVQHICAACYNDARIESHHPESSSACPLYDSEK